MIDYGAFLDSYYAYDSNQPQVSRAYTTQPVKHDTPSINLAHLEMKIQTEKIRSRIALQAGDSVERNAALEPGKEKYIQEAYLGTKLGEKTWVDAGIFLGNIGAESWISKDNWTYSRALNLDYVPYYSAGIRLEHQVDQKQSFQLQVINGWQNVSENNTAKALGMQYKNSLSDTLTFTYNNFLGDEKVVGKNSRFRVYHNFILKWEVSSSWQYLYAFDVGHQSQQNNNGADPLFATTLTARRIFNPDQSMAFRLEYYNDRHKTNIPVQTTKGFQVAGASVNFDQKILEKALWRTELRGFYSEDKIYPKNNGEKNRLDGFLVSSLSIWF
jgi:hypothetical protein